MRKSFIILTFAISSFLLPNQFLQAQANRSNDLPVETFVNVKEKHPVKKHNSSTTNLQSQPTDAPIDGGIGLLLAVGVFYGCKKVRDRQIEFRNNSKELT